MEDENNFAIECKKLSFAYTNTNVVDDVSFTIEANTLCALVGPNGSGKSTLIKCITGLIQNYSGTINIHNTDIQTKSGKNTIKQIGYVGQRHHIANEFPASVFEIVATQRVLSQRRWFTYNKNDKYAIEHAIESVGLKEKMHSSYHELSGGQQQRVLIAKAFAGDPSILILDEPTAGVDASSQELFKEALMHSMKDHNVTVFLVSHELSAVSEIVDKVIVMKNKILFDGTPKELENQGVSLGLHLHDLPIWLERIDESEKNAF